MNLTFTRCQDRSCPHAHARSCQRYDPNPFEAKGLAYFARSPRMRDDCNYFAPTNGALKPRPLTSDWPKDDQ